MPFVDDDEVVEALLTDGTHPAFCISIGVRSANWRMDHLDVLCSKDVIKGRDDHSDIG